MGNRKLPFGYKMAMGEILLHPQEAQAVRDIFKTYLSGASFGSITDWLRNNAPPYDVDKMWNKNMVARILEDKRYIGTERFPAILPPSQLEQAAAQRKERKPCISITEAQKALRRLCNGRPSEAVVGEVLALLNYLIRQPQQITIQPKPVDRGRLAEAEHRFTETLAEAPVDEEQAKALAFQLAELTYESIGGSDYETERLRRLFSTASPASEIDAVLLKETVAKIHVKSGAVSLLLKNGQIIERRA